MFGSQSSFFSKFACVPPRSILIKKIIKQYKRLDLPVTLLSQTEHASSMMFIGIPLGSVVLQKAMQILEHDGKLVPALVQSRFASLGVSKEHRLFLRELSGRIDRPN